MSNNEDGCMTSAFICYYYSMHCNDWWLCCAGKSDFLCIRCGQCCSINHGNLGCGLTTDESKGEICKLSCFCLEYGLVKPQTCYSSASQCLCCRHACSLPFSEEYVPDLVCAVCCIACAPEFGCMVSPPPCPALTEGSAAPRNSEMDRS